MFGVDVRKDRAAVDVDGSVWLYAEFEWRYVVEGEKGACGSALSFDSFAVLPDTYEPYREVDASGTALLYQAARVAPYVYPKVVKGEGDSRG